MSAHASNPRAQFSAQTRLERRRPFGELPWEIAPHPDSSQERAPIALSVVRADGGVPAEFSILASETFLNAEARPLPPRAPMAPVPPNDEARARISLQEDGLFIEAIGDGDGLFRRIRDEETLLLPCELRMGGHHFLLEELTQDERLPAAEFWGASPAPFRARLVDLLRDNMIGDVFLLREGRNIIGRETGDIVCHPTDNFISGRHAQFDVDGNLIILRDLNSSNGTFIRVYGPHPIHGKDQFLLGPHLLKFSLPK